MQEYIIKAVREANVHTRWSQPNEAHETALRDFIAAVLDREQQRGISRSFARISEHLALYGMLSGSPNSA